MVRDGRVSIIMGGIVINDHRIQIIVCELLLGMDLGVGRKIMKGNGWERCGKRFLVW